MSRHVVCHDINFHNTNVTLSLFLAVSPKLCKSPLLKIKINVTLKHCAHYKLLSEFLIIKN